MRLPECAMPRECNPNVTLEMQQSDGDFRASITAAKAARGGTG